MKRNRKLSFRSALLLSLGWAALCGCEPQGAAMYPVAGSVSFEGAPVPDADIFFVPLDTRYGPSAGKVQAGRFACEAIEGSHRVEIRALRPLPDHPPGPLGAPACEAYLPERYNTFSELTAEVSADDTNEFRFDLHQDPERVSHRQNGEIVEGISVKP